MENEQINKWIVFTVRDKYANDHDREKLKNDILSKFILMKDDVYYVPVLKGSVFCNFLFVKEHDANDMRSIYDYRNDYFDAYSLNVRISNDEFLAMTNGIDRNVRKTIKYGDIVIIKKGMYSKLHGIALRECRSKKVEVGMKFCFGNVIEQYDPEDVTVIGNIFNYLKVLD